MGARSIFATMFLLVSALFAEAQGVMTVTGAPFMGTWTGTTERAGKIETNKTVAARMSDGSVYRAIYKDGLLDFIEIDDVLHEKRIEIRPQQKMYTEKAAPHDKWTTRTAEQQHSILERWNIAYTRQATNQDKVATPLGVKIVDGMTVYGHHFVRTRDNMVTMVGDDWQSDLGFTYSEHVEEPREKKIVTSILAEMKRGEPDASLFTVPAGYYQQVVPHRDGQAAISQSCDGTDAPAGGPPPGVAGSPCPLPPPYSTAPQMGSRAGAPPSGDGFSNIGEPLGSGPPPGPHL